MSAAIVIRGVCHEFGTGRAVLRDLSLTVPARAIYGFLGPNGAGKTTTIRLLLGLMRLQRGEIVVLGRSIRDEARTVRRQVGSLVELPSLYGHLSARENLDIWRAVYQAPRSRGEDVLELVGLHRTGRQRVREFSLGMRQRLGLAIALLHRPSLLLLDEPTNGLDPHGIVEMRALLRRLNMEEQVTIFLSSHLLSEVERLVTHVCVLSCGQVAFDGTLREFTTAAGRDGTIIHTADTLRAAEVLRTDATIDERTGAIRIPTVASEQVAAAVSRLVVAGVDVHQVFQDPVDLERYFLALTAPARASEELHPATTTPLVRSVPA